VQAEVVQLKNKMKLSTLDYSLQLLDLLSKHPEGLSLMEISEMAGFTFPIISIFSLSGL
jgi:hypothetical protein